MSALDEVMTPVEIEREYGLKPGAVRQYLFNHQQDMIARRVARKADQRTWIILKSEVRKIWGEPPSVKG